MIAGATYTLPVTIPYEIEKANRVLVTLKNESTGIMRIKHYPHETETWLMPDGRLGVRLSQQDTIDLVGYVKIEAQINLKSGAVAKTKTERTYIASTLNTEIVEGAADNGENLLDGVTLELGAPITAEGEGTSFQPGNALELKDGILNVLTTDDAEKGNNLPITSEGARKLADNISYNDLTDRPFYEETEVVNEPLNITWDGNTEGLVSINNQFYKVSDLALTDEEIKLSTIEFNNILMPIGDSWEEGLANGQVIPSEEATSAFLIIVARKDKAIISNGTIEIEIPEKGIYFGVNPGGYVSALTTTEPIEQTKTVVHKLDEKYLPDGATVYYGDDVYLYHDSAQTRKVTKEELRVAYQSGTIYIYANTYTEYVTDLHLALCVNVDSSKGYVSFMWGDSTRWKTLYTTEYVETES